MLIKLSEIFNDRDGVNEMKVKNPKQGPSFDQHSKSSSIYDDETMVAQIYSRGWGLELLNSRNTSSTVLTASHAIP